MSLLDRPVGLKTAFVAVGLTLLLYLLVLLLVYTLAASKITASFPLRDTAMAIQLPKFMPVTSSVHNELRAELNQTLDVTVPVDQWVSARFPKRISLDATLDTVVNLETTIRYQDEIAVTAIFDMVVPVSNPIMPIELPVLLPLTFRVPVDLTVPVNHPLPVAMRLPVIASVPDPVPVHLQASLRSQVPIDTSLDASVITQAEAHLMFPTAPVDLSLAQADLSLGIGDLSLVRRSLDYPRQVAVGSNVKMPAETLIYIYDAAKRPPDWR